MPVGEHCRRDPLTVRREDTIRDVAKCLETRDAGCAVVVGASGRPVGVLTDRDIALRVLRRGLDPDATTAADVMATDLVSLRENTPLTTAMRRLRTDGLRRLPVVDGEGALVGVFHWNDAVAIIAGELQQAASVAAGPRARGDSDA